MGEPGRLITAKPRYEDMLETNTLIAREQLICGCHVHVTVESDRDRIQVLNQIRSDLHCLIALSANSPFWEGEDSGFASFRTEVWTRWPTAGPPASFANIDEYARLIEQLVAAEVILDEGMAYWDVRLSRQYPTIEIRIADVGLEVQDSVTVAGLARALVMNCLRQPRGDEAVRPELLRAASWKAARTGVDGDLIDPRTGGAVSASDYFDNLLARLAPDLSESGDLRDVEEGIHRILSAGTGADRQRTAAGQELDLGAVVELTSVKR
jgi:carboxylate-amine ligase